MDDDELSARFLREGTLAEQRDYWRIDDFLRENKGRRDTYYRFIDRQIDTFTEAAKPPDDGCLRDIVFLMLKQDRSYRVFLKGHGAEEELLEDAAWSNLLTAGAGTILCQHAKDRAR